MSRNGKILLGAVAGMLMLCMCVGMAGVAGVLAMGVRAAPHTGVVSQAVQVETIMANKEPLAYEMPVGWNRAFNFHLFGMEVIGLDGNDGHSHIYLMQLPPDRDAESTLREALSSAPSRQTTYRNGMVLREVGRQTVIIHGQQVTMKISEGTNRAGETYRQMAGVYRGADAQVLVVVEQPVKNWDQSMVDGFIASIR